MDGKSKSKTKGKAKAFVIEPEPQWYLLVDSLEETAPTPTASQFADLQIKASSLHAQALAAHSDVGTESSSKDGTFLQKVLQGGTLSDRLSALTLLVQGSPLHNTKALESLKGLAERGRGKGGRDESLKAVRAISDWWVGGGAPMRKLRYFRDQPLLHPNVTDRHLAVWYFEDWLKKYFFSLLHVLETLSMDPLPYVRTQSITFIFNLLKDRPEQEQNLLRLLVNKLGDHERTICSRVSYYLLQLMQAHPSMKSVVVREMTALALKPAGSSLAAAGATGTPKHIRFDDNMKAKPATEKPKSTLANNHAAYYATITFNQIVLSPSSADQQVARTLIDVYFTFFRDILGVMERSGVQPDENDDEDESGPKKYGKGQAKAKTLGSTFLEVEDSTSRHVSAILTGVNRALPFAKLTLDDVNFSKHIDTLFLITHQSTFNISLQAMLLLQQITASSLQTKMGNVIVDRYYRTLYASLHDSRLASSNKHAMYLNLLFKSIKVDPSSERVVAFVRRFLQVLAAGGGGGPEFTAGGLFLIGELFSTIKDLRPQVSSPATRSDVSTSYDARKRDPLFAHASSSPMWELTPLLHHYHPAVALHARQLLSGQPVTASPDLALNTLSHFLDRFIYKKPKQAKPKGASVMQPAASANASGTAEGVRRLRGDAADLEGLMNDPKLLKRRVEDVPVDQVFFHKYFARKKEKERSRGGQKAGEGGDEDEAESEDSEEEAGDEEEVASGDDAPATSEDEEEAEIWTAMKATMPKVDGDDDLLDASGVDQDDSSEDGGFDFDSDESDDEQGLPVNGGEDSEESAHEGVEAEDDDGDLAEGSDAEDLLDLDADVAVGLIPTEGDASDEDSDAGEWGGVDTKSRKRTARDDDRRVKKRKLRSLPTFASVEDYAALIDASPEDNI